MEILSAHLDTVVLDPQMHGKAKSGPQPRRRGARIGVIKQDRGNKAQESRDREERNGCGAWAVVKICFGQLIGTANGRAGSREKIGD